MNNTNFENIIKKVENYRIQYNFREKIIEGIYEQIESLLQDTVEYKPQNDILTKIEKYFDIFITSKIGGILTLFILLSIVMWITLIGAGYISELLTIGFIKLEMLLRNLFKILKIPEMLANLMIDGVYKSVSMVVAVMLPPMAIFFPLFTFLEDLGLLPRIALNMDRIFKTVGAHGNQALTMMVGLGCNAAGIISTRIIKSPKERIIAILTNNFMPCNGRWPLLILVSSIFISPIVSTTINPTIGSLVGAITLVFSIMVGLAFTLIVSLGLSRFLKSFGSFYILEIPPFRKPNIWRILYTSIIDRTIFVLMRAVYMAAPIGVLVWLINYFNLSKPLIEFFDPFGKLVGLDGVIILSYIIALPANEIVIPSLLMLYTNSKNFVEIEELNSIYQIFAVYGNWDWKTAINIMLFSILHNPCTTTILTIYKETNSIWWTTIATLLPLLIAFSTLFILNNFVFY